MPNTGVAWATIARTGDSWHGTAIATLFAYDATDGRLLDETALAKLEARMAVAAEPSAPVVPNSAAKRSGSEPPRERTSKEIEAELRAIPNPYQGWNS